MPWKHAFLDDRKHSMIKDYFISGYPNAYLIDEKGIILANGNQVRGDKLIQTLENHFKSKENTTAKTE
jgi:hypothetical protein